MYRNEKYAVLKYNNIVLILSILKQKHSIYWEFSHECLDIVLCIHLRKT